MHPCAQQHALIRVAVLQIKVPGSLQDAARASGNYRLVSGDAGKVLALAVAHLFCQ
jgi:hypothetical protein